MKKPIRICVRLRQIEDIRGIPIALGLLACFVATAPAGQSPTSLRPAPGGENAAIAADQLGQTIRITLPLDHEVVSRVTRSVRQALDRARARGVRAVLIFEFDLARGAAAGGAGSRFTDAYELAHFLSGEELNAATTVAFLPKSIQGHAVLVALACDQIIMAEEATIGNAGADETTVDETMRAAYDEIARRRRTLPVELALGMLRPDADVLKVQTEASTEYVTPAGLEKLRKHHTIQSQEPLIHQGEPGQFSGAWLRRYGLVKRLASSRLEVIRALGLREGAAGEDPSQGGKWQAIRVDLKGVIDAEKVSQVERLIQDKMRLGNVNFVCVWIDSAGGPPDECLGLAEFLADLDPAAVRTVAYIPDKALAQAALVAMACDQIVMHPEAVLGGPGSPQMSHDEIEVAEQTIRKQLAPRKMRSWSLWAAMIDPMIEVYRCTRLGDEEFFSAEELAQAEAKLDVGGNGPHWQQGPCVTTPSRAFRGTQAVDLQLANHTVGSFAEFKQRYHLEDDPTLAEPGWADLLVDYLSSPGVSAVLLIIGGAALYLELHAPGLGLGGFVSAVCFLLFFWSHYLPSTAFWLEITLFLAGLGCVLTEVFVVPGAGIFGLGGSAMVLVSLVLASQTFVVPHNNYEFALLQRSLLTVAGAAGGVLVTVLLIRRWLPRAPVLRHMMLEPPAGEEARTISRREMLVDLDKLLGARGIATTQLTPGGKARFGNSLVDVLAVGELVPRDTPVIVTEVHGNRILVKPVDSD